MKKQTITLLSLLLIVMTIGMLLAACGQANAPAPSSPGAALDGKALMQERCSVCHSTDRITSAHKTADKWKATVERMVGKGAQLNAEEQQALVDYLTQTYP